MSERQNDRWSIKSITNCHSLTGCSRNGLFIIYTSYASSFIFLLLFSFTLDTIEV